jgi:hypothetical protein
VALLALVLLAVGVALGCVVVMVASVRCGRQSARLATPDDAALEESARDSTGAERGETDPLDLAAWAERHR